MTQQSILSFFKPPSPPSSSISASSSSMFPPILPVQEIDTSFYADLSVNLSRSEIERMVSAQLHKLRELREKLLARETRSEDFGCSKHGNACTLSSSSAPTPTHTEMRRVLAEEEELKMASPRSHAGRADSMVVDSDDNDTDIDDDNDADSMEEDGGDSLSKKSRARRVIIGEGKGPRISSAILSWRESG